MSTLKTHNLQSPDAGSVNIVMTPNAGMVVTGITTVGNTSDSFTSLNITSSTSGISELRFTDNVINAGYVKYQHSDNVLILATNTLERLRIASDGVITGRGELRLTQGHNTVSNGSEIGSLMYTYPSNDNKNAKIVALSNGGSSGADLAFFTRTQGDATNNDGGEERLRIKSDGNITISNTATSPTGDFRMLTLIARSDKQASIGFAQASGVYSGATATAGYTVRLAGDGALELATHNSNIIALKATQTGNVEMVGDLSTNNLSGRNILINGDMRVAQRATSANMSNHGNTIDVCDRWVYNRNGVTGTLAQVAEVPDGSGFTKSNYKSKRY